jgi:hypothetical protein
MVVEKPIVLPVMRYANENLGQSTELTHLQAFGGGSISFRPYEVKISASPLNSVHGFDPPSTIRHAPGTCATATFQESDAFFLADRKTAEKTRLRLGNEALLGPESAETTPLRRVFSVEAKGNGKITPEAPWMVPGDMASDRLTNTALGVQNLCLNGSDRWL